MNIFRVALDYRDTILLVDEQLTRIIALERQFILEDDSLATAAARQIVARGETITQEEFERIMGFGGSETEKRAFRAREGLMVAKWGRLLREILTPEQWQQLPYWVSVQADAAIASEDELRAAATGTPNIRKPDKPEKPKSPSAPKRPEAGVR
jgi:hypothetical protein